MYSAQSLSGTESSSFQRYWDSLKNKLSEIDLVGFQIRQLWDRAKIAHTTEQDPVLRQKLGEQLSRLSDMLMTWNSVKEKMDTYLPNWVKISKVGSQTESLGALPFILPAWALASLLGGGLAAITYVSTHGLNLLKQYQSERDILTRLEQGRITEGAATGIITSMQPQPGSDPFSALTSGVGKMIPVVLGVGALIFFGPMLMAQYGSAAKRA